MHMADGAVSRRSPATSKTILPTIGSGIAAKQYDPGAALFYALYAYLRPGILCIKPPNKTTLRCSSGGWSPSWMATRVSAGAFPEEYRC
jgi:hypothetical protein